MVRERDLDHHDDQHDDKGDEDDGLLEQLDADPEVDDVLPVQAGGDGTAGGHLGRAQSGENQDTMEVSRLQAYDRHSWRRKNLLLALIS